MIKFLGSFFLIVLYSLACGWGGYKLAFEKVTAKYEKEKTEYAESFSEELRAKDSELASLRASNADTNALVVKLRQQSYQLSTKRDLQAALNERDRCFRLLADFSEFAKRSVDAVQWCDLATRPSAAQSKK